jgi:hypothetical protein
MLILESTMLLPDITMLHLGVTLLCLGIIVCLYICLLCLYITLEKKRPRGGRVCASAYSVSCQLARFGRPPPGGQLVEKSAALGGGEARSDGKPTLVSEREKREVHRGRLLLTPSRDAGLRACLRRCLIYEQPGCSRKGRFYVVRRSAVHFAEEEQRLPSGEEGNPSS